MAFGDTTNDVAVVGRQALEYSLINLGDPESQRVKNERDDTSLRITLARSEAAIINRSSRPIEPLATTVR